tara:strand:+ start:192 stop:308 length:117 start_codon:yes stop_codon:yes gene_type:complete
MLLDRALYGKQLMYKQSVRMREQVLDWLIETEIRPNSL